MMKMNKKLVLMTLVIAVVLCCCGCVVPVKDNAVIVDVSTVVDSADGLGSDDDNTGVVSDVGVTVPDAGESGTDNVEVKKPEGNSTADNETVASVVEVKVCAYCEQTGHEVENCAKKAADEAPCTYCKKTGHKVDDCSVKKADEAPCNYCKQAGHKIDACPKKIADEARPKGCAYCGVAGHSAKKCVKKAVDKGAVGRWSIPDVGVNVALYSEIMNAQKITDAEDSAFFLKYGSQEVIADHNYQGFDAIKKCKAGTVAYLETERGKEKYICTKVMKGYNTKYEITDTDGNPLRNSNPGGITCYTCNENSRNITIVFFALG